MTQINGLLTQKPDSPEPQAGNTVWFEWEQREGKSGKPYMKIKNSKPEYGQSCEVVKAEKTDFTDSHGNISFNVSFIPQDGEGGVGGAASSKGSAQAPPSTSDQYESIEARSAVHGAVQLVAAGKSADQVPALADAIYGEIQRLKGSADPKSSTDGQAPKSDEDIPF